MVLLKEAEEDDKYAERVYKRERLWWGVAAFVGFLVLRFFFNPSDENWKWIFSLVFFWYISHYFGYEFAAISRKLKRIENELGVE